MRKIRNLFIPDSAVPEARWNPGATKASDCEVSKSFCALARRRYEARHPLEAPLIDVCSGAETHRLCCGRVAPRVFVNRNCGIRVKTFPTQLAMTTVSKKKGAKRTWFARPLQWKIFPMNSFALSLPDRFHVSVEPLLWVFQKLLISDRDWFSTFRKGRFNGSPRLKIVS